MKKKNQYDNSSYINMCTHTLSTRYVMGLVSYKQNFGPMWKKKNSHSHIKEYKYDKTLSLYTISIFKFFFLFWL